MRAGEDVIGQAKTGSGKTAAFALPILEKLAEDPYGVFALVLTPSRYLIIFTHVISCLDVNVLIYVSIFMNVQRIGVSNL